MSDEGQPGDIPFHQRYGSWAVVTGAGQGIGAALVADLASRGVHVVVVDRDEAALRARASDLAASGAHVRSLVVDLAAPGAAGRVVQAVSDLDVGLLVSNAARAYVGPFLDQDLSDSLAQLDVNCRAPLELVHGLLPRLVARRRGGIILMASGSAQRGAPLVAGYAATKAWNRILAESLWDEVRDLGVDVLAVLPGSTRTPGWLSSQPQSSVGTSGVMLPAEVASEALDALGSGPSLVCGEANRESEAFLSSLERAEAVRLTGDVMRRMYPAVREPDPAV